MLVLAKSCTENEVKELANQCEETKNTLKSNVMEIIKLINNMEISSNEGTKVVKSKNVKNNKSAKTT